MRPIQKEKNHPTKKPMSSLTVGHGGCFRCWEKQRWSTSSPYITKWLLARPQDEALPFSPFPTRTSNPTYAALSCPAAPFAAEELVFMLSLNCPFKRDWLLQRNQTPGSRINKPLVMCNICIVLICVDLGIIFFAYQHGISG